MSLKILLLGSKGLLGSNLVKLLKGEGFEIIGYHQSEVDVVNKKVLFDIIHSHLPLDVLINATGYLPADKCEQNFEESYKVNVNGILNIAKALKIITPKTILIHFSTDFVFDGKKGNYSEEDIPHPLNTYGWHKLIGDCIIQSSLEKFYIFRIASLIGYGEYKQGFLQKILNLAKKENEVEIVSDLIISMSTPEWIFEVLKNFLILQPTFGIYNVVAKGETSWYLIVKKAFEWLDIHVEIRPISYRDFRYIAKRPINSSLSTNKLSKVLKDVKNWEEVLKEHIQKFYKEYRSVYEN